MRGKSPFSPHSGKGRKNRRRYLMQKNITVEGRGITITAIICGEPTPEEVELVTHKLVCAIAEARLEAQQP